MIKKLFYSADPTIAWEKVFCPICGEPTGPTSECYDKKPDGIPDYKLKLQGKGIGPLPIFSQSCIYRADNLWEASINYPFSQKMFEKMVKISGVERIIPLKKYTFQVAIGKAFDESLVKRQINEVFKTTIKYYQSKEINKVSIKVENKEKIISGILFPNGQRFESNLETQEMFQDILNNMPGTTPIYLESLDVKNKVVSE